VLLVMFGCLSCGSADETRAAYHPPEPVPKATVQTRSCPEFGWWMTLPRSLPVGATTEIMVNVSDADTPLEKIALEWVAETGSFSTPNLSDTSYTCELEGQQRLALVARDDTDCLRTLGVDIECFLR
jgi:hypothetical protein